MDLSDERAPDFELDTTTGGRVRLSHTLDRGPSVVILFRGYWCSYCAEQLQTYSALGYDLWRHEHVDILPVTNDPLPALVEMRDRFELGIQLLSDPGLGVARDYTGTEEHDRYGTIPIPGTFIVDTDGIVQYAHVADTVSDRTYANHVRTLITPRHGERFADPFPAGYYD